jgi:hypothetical protein
MLRFLFKIKLLIPSKSSRTQQTPAFQQNQGGFIQQAHELQRNLLGLTEPFINKNLKLVLKF